MLIKELAVSDVSVFPNPTTGELRVTSDKLQVTSVEVFDIYGRMQKSRTSATSAALSTSTLSFQKEEKQNGEWSFDLSNLANGVYLLRIQTEHGIITKKVIKH
jgi:hypothetical protein